jgi:lipopolysaccharide/colanic/teichoic acid biosynthesis glycosyltransferase
MLYKNLIKRILDLLAAVTALLFFMPFMLIIILLLLLTGHTRLFFVQKRVGLNDKIFPLIKFISMTNEKDAAGHLLPDEKRLTRFGSFLRKSSLDELPQLINVIKGDMSIIGPRPLLVNYLPLYNERQRKRHLVRPGITGWAQVNGRNAISWQQKFEYDIWYVENQSFLLDLRIFFITIGHTLLRKDISQAGHVTVEPFNGKN